MKRACLINANDHEQSQSSSIRTLKTNFVRIKSLEAFIIFLFISMIGFAQSSQYHDAMDDAFKLFKISKTADSLQLTASKFERIAQAEKTQWLPYYYAVQVSVIRSFQLKTDEEKDLTLDKAQEWLEEASMLHPDSSEIMAMQGFIYVAKLQVSPISRGREYSEKSNRAFDKAIELNPENPRGYYLKANTIMNTPKFFGGGKEAAMPYFTIAMEKFGTFKKAAEFYPNWGKSDCRKKLEKCLEK